MASGSMVPALVPILAFAGLWLRLVWRTRHERARRSTLVAVLRAMPRGSTLDHRTLGGGQLRITIDHERPSRDTDTTVVVPPMIEGSTTKRGPR